MGESIRHCLCLDLKGDAKLILDYEKHHRNVWPDVLHSLREAGIISAEIYRWNNRLFMILETKPSFSFEEKANLDQQNKKVMEWEELMWKYQQSLPGVEDGSKWQVMKKIFDMSGD